MEVLTEVYSALPYDDEIYGDLRTCILLGLERMGRKTPEKVADVVRSLADREAGKGGAALVWNQRLNALRLFLEHLN